MPEQGVAIRYFQTGIKWICESFYLVLSGESAVSEIIYKGISHMGTIYFLLLVAAGLSGAFLVLRRINSKSYFFCAINEAVDHEESKAARRGTEVEHPKVAAYVDWYTRKFDNDSDSRDEIFVGAAHMINGPIAEVAVPKRQANC